MNNIKFVLGIALSVPFLQCAMENFGPKMAVVKTFQEAQQFADRFVMYQPRQTLGEEVALPKENAQLNYGYVDPEFFYFPDGASKPKGPAYLTLFALCHYQSEVVTRAISDKTLTLEPLSLRLADEAECERVRAILQNTEYNLAYSCPPRMVRIYEDSECYCQFSRRNLRSFQGTFKMMEDVLNDHIALLQQNEK